MCGKTGAYPQKEQFVRAVNETIDHAHQQGRKIVYICQEFHRFDFFCFMVMGGRLLQGTAGASLCLDLNKVGDVVFTKHQQDAFTSQKLAEYLNKNKVGSVFIAGLDSSSCVYKTALGAANRGYSVTVMRNSVLGMSKERTEKALQKLFAKGISIV